MASEGRGKLLILRVCSNCILFLNIINLCLGWEVLKCSHFPVTVKRNNEDDYSLMQASLTCWTVQQHLLPNRDLTSFHCPLAVRYRLCYQTKPTLAFFFLQVAFSPEILANDPSFSNLYKYLNKVVLVS